MIALAILTATLPATHGAHPTASDLVREALAAQGGEQAPRAIGTTRLRSIAVANALEQSGASRGTLSPELRGLLRNIERGS